MITNNRPDRKAYPRLLAPVYFIKAGRLSFFGRRRRVDGAPGGVCVYTDEEPEPGGRCILEVFLPDGSSVVCRTEVAWIERLPDGGVARFDVGLRFTAIHPLDRQRLAGVLEHA